MTVELLDEVANDWGSLSKRTLLRSISRLRRAGRIVWTSDGYVLASAARRAA